MGCLSTFSWCERWFLAFFLNFFQTPTPSAIVQEFINRERRFGAQEVAPSVQPLLWRPGYLNPVLSTYINNSLTGQCRQVIPALGSRGREIPGSCWASRLAAAVCSRFHLRPFLARQEGMLFRKICDLRPPLARAHMKLRKHTLSCMHIILPELLLWIGCYRTVDSIHNIISEYRMKENS